MATDPASWRIRTYPAPVLRKRAEAVGAVDEAVRGAAVRMIKLMREAEGIGLAAPQVGLSWRLFVAHVPRRAAEDGEPECEVVGDGGRDEGVLTWTPEPMVFVNPELSGFSRDLEPFEEGCLSLPGITGDVRRPSSCTVSALDLDGAAFSVRAGGLLARCVQHECDHLDGVLIIDKMSLPHRMRNRSSLRSLEEGGRPFGGR